MKGFGLQAKITRNLIFIRERLSSQGGLFLPLQYVLRLSKLLLKATSKNRCFLLSKKTDILVKGKIFRRLWINF
jgi:hypothetical protein